MTTPAAADSSVSAGACINSCGNGLVDAADGELCDDGNKVNGDGCNNNCQYSCANPSTDCTAAPVCYVAQCSAGHVCQNAVDATQNDQPCASGKVCSAGACIIACGNGIVDPGEQCDDGNQVNGDGCNNDCTSHVRGSSNRLQRGSSLPDGDVHERSPLPGRRGPDPERGHVRRREGLSERILRRRVR